MNKPLNDSYYCSSQGIVSKKDEVTGVEIKTLVVNDVYNLNRNNNCKFFKLKTKKVGTYKPVLSTNNKFYCIDCQNFFRKH